MLRHTVFFIHRDTTTSMDRFEMLKGLTYVQSEAAGPVAGDHGEDIFGGSARLRDIKPYERIPRWRVSSEGPPSDYDVALHLDFEDQAGMDTFNADQGHHRVGDYNALINDAESTARLDWWYDGLPMTRRGLIRHTAMFIWADEAGDTERQQALDSIRRLESAPGVVSVAIGVNVGTLTTDYDWLYDIHITDREFAQQLLKGNLFSEVMATVVPVTKHEWTARLTHVMRGISRLPADRLAT